MCPLTTITTRTTGTKNSREKRGGQATEVTTGKALISSKHIKNNKINKQE